MSTQNLRMWPYLEIGSLQMQLVRMRSSWIKEKAMAPHSSTLAWKILWMEEPGRLQSMGSARRVGHDWATSLSLFTFVHWRRKWQPTPVFLPGESQGRGSLVGFRLGDRTESDTTEATLQQQNPGLKWTLNMGSLMVTWRCRVDTHTYEATTPGMPRIASNHQSLEEARKSSLLELLEEMWLYQHLNFRILVSRIVRE